MSALAPKKHPITLCFLRFNAMRLTLFQPEIPQNTGTLIRLGACLNVPIDLIEPCGFVLTDKGLKRAGMDYIDLAVLNRYISWKDFMDNRPLGRLIFLTPESPTPYHLFSFNHNDTLLLGSESTGIPQELYSNMDATVSIPMVPERRSLNVAIAAAMVLGEALKQTNLFPRTL
jgi:tRNA (cytidine/uridine-2'-O-)-methyltransferase